MNDQKKIPNNLTAVLLAVLGSVSIIVYYNGF